MSPPPEKSKFAQTCNRLSLYLKEKGNIRDLNPRIFDVTAKAATTTVDLLSNIGEKVEKSAKPDQYVVLDSSCEIEADSTNKPSPSDQSVKPETAQMTIFYQGQVLVLDDLPADRARDLMLMANNPNPVVEPSKSKEAIGAKDSDLPIARRASLHKFLAKRKDRATIRAPYHQSPGGSSSGNHHGFDLNM